MFSNEFSLLSNREWELFRRACCDHVYDIWVYMEVYTHLFRSLVPICHRSYLRVVIDNPVSVVSQTVADPKASV